MRQRLRVMALTGAILLSGAPSAYADADADAPAPSASPQSSTTLQVRPSKPLTLAPESSGSGFGFSGFFAMLLLAVAGFVVWKRRRDGTDAAKGRADSLSILRRASIGVRSELLVVKAEGKRLLLGVTPTSITTLSVLADEDEDFTNALVAGVPAISPSGVAEPAAPPSRADAAAASPASEPVPAAPTTTVPSDAQPQLEGQIRGLASLRRLR